MFLVCLGDAFQSLQSSFLEKYYDQFEETEENKFIYSDIHQEYVRCYNAVVVDAVYLLLLRFSLLQTFSYCLFTTVYLFYLVNSILLNHEVDNGSIFQSFLISPIRNTAVTVASHLELISPSDCIASRLQFLALA